MRLNLFPSGLVDDLVVEDAPVRLSRTGIARYALTIALNPPITVILWTSRKGCIACNLWHTPPTWIAIRLSAIGELEELEATSCMLHLEHLDRGLYALGLARMHEHWGLLLRTSGYLKARVEL
ncbi:MAG: hypothetical protein MI924_23000 [Chloroflexales bacterium]|nr:hypothetical protein [Chloroflexales bacterium]